MLNFWCGESPYAEGRPVSYRTCKCSAGHADWGMLTGRHPAPRNATKLFGSGVVVSASPAMFKRQ